MENMEIFFELHKDNPREGPGDNKSTAKAYSFLTDLPAKPSIVDIGCGPGMQTIELAKLSGQKIKALDFHQPFLDMLTNKIKGTTFEGSIEIINGSMTDLPFEKENFDIIWSEGAIFVMGYKAGINYWKDFLKPKGYIVVSEITWLKNYIPKELRNFFDSAYTEMAPISEKIKIIEDAGLVCIGHFILPVESWWKEYYDSINEKLPAFREKYKDNPEAMQVLESEIIEQDLLEKYSDYYNYVFYIMQKL